MPPWHQACRHRPFGNACSPMVPHCAPHPSSSNESTQFPDVRSLRIRQRSNPMRQNAATQVEYPSFLVFPGVFFRGVTGSTLCACVLRHGSWYSAVGPEVPWRLSRACLMRRVLLRRADNLQCSSRRDRPQDAHARLRPARVGGYPTQVVATTRLARSYQSFGRQMRLPRGVNVLPCGESYMLPCPRAPVARSLPVPTIRQRVQPHNASSCASPAILERFDPMHWWFARFGYANGLF